MRIDCQCAIQLLVACRCRNSQRNSSCSRIMNGDDGDLFAVGLDGWMEYMNN